MESPPHVIDPDQSEDRKADERTDVHQRRVTTKKSSLNKTIDSRLRYAGSWAPQSQNENSDDEDDGSVRTSFLSTETKQSAFRIGDECISERCSECGALKEEYTDEELGLFIVILGTFIHREPALACPFLPDILVFVSKMAHHHTFSWQYESSTHLPGGSQA